MTEYSSLNPYVSETAAEWFAEFRVGSLDEQALRKFDAWLRASPEHVQAYLEYASIWEEAGWLGLEALPDVETLLSQLGSEPNVVPLTQARSNAGTGPAHARKWLLGWPAGIAAGVMVAMLAVGGWMANEGRSSYATHVGEQRSITLPDGSVVELNARSRIKVRWSSTERRVELLEGQALFQVAKDAQRPFTVHTDRTSVRAVGTQFDVYRKPEGTVVTVLEGRVAVSGRTDRRERVVTAVPDTPVMSPISPGLATGTSVLLEAGEQATVANAGGVRKQPGQVSLKAVTAWTQRQMILEAASLQEVVRELNRYSSRQFVVDASVSEELRLSGVFSTTDTEFLLRFLKERPDIQVDDAGAQVLIRQTQPVRRH